MPPLSLAWLTVSGAHPLDHIDAALAAGFQSVGLRVVPPTPGDPMVPVVGDEALVRRIRERLDATGVEVLDVETLWIRPDIQVPSLRPMLDVARRLGARSLLTMGVDTDAARLADNFAVLCDEAHAFDMAVGIEFSAYSDVPNLAAADRLVGAAGRDNGKILVDALHFARSGGVPDDLKNTDPQRLAYCQLADARGPRPMDPLALRNEARGGRYLPGEGELPLAALLQALPRGIPLSVEAPCAAHAGLSVAERAMLAGDAARRFLGALTS